jgi:sigma-B regulation protein RsbU (phosphoserine phosphatase)
MTGHRTPRTEIVLRDDEPVLSGYAPATSEDGVVVPDERASGAFRWMRDAEDAPLPTTIRLRQRNTLKETPDILTAFQHRLMGEPLAGLSGDFWDFTMLHRSVITITQGDVSGHGIRAGAVMAAAKTATATVMSDGLPLVPSMSAINRQLYGRIGGHFVTMASMRIDLTDGEAALVRAGHTSLFHWVEASGQVVIRAPRGVAIGMVDPQAATIPLVIEERFDVAPGDVLLLATDGMRESMNAKHDEYGDERLAEIVARHATEPAAMIAFHMTTKAHSFRGGRPPEDDEMVVVVKRSV